MDVTRNTKGHYFSYHSFSAVDVQKTRSAQEIQGTYIIACIHPPRIGASAAFDRLSTLKKFPIFEKFDGTKLLCFLKQPQCGTPVCLQTYTELLS